MPKTPLTVAIRIDAQDASGAALPLRFASHDVPELCHWDGQQWEPALAQLPDFALDFFGGGFHGQVTAPTTGFVVASFGLPGFSATPAARARFADARVRVWVGDYPATGMVLRFDGRLTGEPEIDEATRIARFDAAVQDSWADDPLLDLFAGTGGIEGPADLTGQPKPLVLGNAQFCGGVLIDQVDNVWMVSNGAVQAVTAVFDRLASLGPTSGNHADLAALLAADIPNGSWATCLAQGLVRLGAPPDGRVSFHVSGSNAGTGGYVRRPGAIIRRIADLAGGTVNAASLTALDTARPYNLARDLREQVTPREIIARIADSVAAVAGVSLTGELFAQALGIGTPGAVLNGDGTSALAVASVEELAKAAPAWRLATEAEPTFEVHSADEAAFSYRWQGEYSATRRYRIDDVVTGQDGATWRYINETPATDQDLPIWPATENDYWINFSPPPAQSVTIDGDGAIQGIGTGAGTSVWNGRVVLAGAEDARPGGGNFVGQLFAVVDPSDPEAQPSTVYRWDGDQTGWVIIATNGAVLPAPGAVDPGAGVVSNIRNHLGQIYDPGELLNTSIELTPGGRLQYRPLPDVPPVDIGQIEAPELGISLTPDGRLQYQPQPEVPPVSMGQVTLPDIGAASADAMRRAEDDVDALATALATALDEASRTRQTFTDAGFFVDPATGQVRIHAVEQTLEQLNTAEIRLDAAEASINLRATTNYVNEAIAQAVLDPSQIADLDTIFVRLTAAEVDIDGLNATVTTLATVTELSLVAGRVTTAEQAIDALEGTISTRVDTTTFDALATRVTSAESTLTAIGDTAEIINAVRSVRLVERDQDANAEADLRALLQGDRAQRDNVAALASARQELRTDISDGLAAEAVQRLALQVRIGQAEATAATESVARISGDNALASQITALTATTNASLGALSASLTAEQTTRTNADSAIAADLSALSASVTTSLASLSADLEAEEAVRIAAINTEAAARVAAVQAEAAARGAALTAEEQARIAAIEAERDQTLADIAAEAAARAQAVATLTSAVTTEQQARVDGDAALAASITTLEAEMDTEVSNRAAAVETVNQARIDGDALIAAGLAQQATAGRVLEGEASDLADELLATLVQGDRNRRNVNGALAGVRQEITAQIIEDREAFASSLTALVARIAGTEASIISEQQVRSTADAALATSITSLDASFTAAIGSVAADVAAEEAARIAAVSAEAASRVAAIQAEAAARGQALTVEEQARIAAINAERDQTLADIAAEAAEREAAVATLTSAVTTEQQARVDGDAALAASITTLEAEMDTEVSNRAAAVETVNQARVDGDAALASSVSALSASVTTSLASLSADLEAEEAVRIAAINTEAAARVAAVQAEAAARGAALTAEEQARIAAIEAERDQTLADIAAEAAARAAAVSTLTASINTANQARVDGDAALAGQITTLEAELDSEVSNRAAAVQTVNQARVNGDAALAASITSLSADLDSEILTRSAAINTANQARVDGDSALAGQITTLTAALDSEVADLAAAISTEQQARTDADGALATSITSLNASFTAAFSAETQARVTAIQSEAQARTAAVNAEADARIAAISQEANNRGTAILAEEQDRIAAINAERTQTLADVAAEAAARQAAVTSLTASIQQEAVARADADSAIAGTVTTLTTTVNAQSATLTEFAESIDGVEARQGVRLDVNGRITGYVQNNDGTEGNFIIVSDNFKVVDPDTGAAFIDADEDGLKLQNGRVIMDNGTFIKAIGVGFGTTGQFIEWFGPRTTGGDLALCNEANALAYLKTNGDAYFGGSLSAGVLRNAARSTSIAANASVEVGPFGTNGDPIQVITSYSIQSGTTADYPATTQGLNDWDAAVTAWGTTATGSVGNRSVNANKAISCNVVVQVNRALGAEAPAQWATLTITGGTENLTGFASTPGDAPGFLTYTRNISGSITSTDNTGGTQNRTFIATITTRTDAVTGSIQSQIVAVTATEE